MNMVKIDSHALATMSRSNRTTSKEEEAVDHSGKAMLLVASETTTATG